MDENKKIKILYFIIFILTAMLVWICCYLHYYAGDFYDYNQRLNYYKYTLQKEKAKQCEKFCFDCPERKFNYDTGECEELSCTTPPCLFG